MSCGFISLCPYGLLQASWGSQRVISAHVSFTAILKSMYKVSTFLNTPHHHIIAYEMALSMARLVKKYGRQLRVEWPRLLPVALSLCCIAYPRNSVFRILRALTPYFDVTGTTSLLPNVFDAIRGVEELYKAEVRVGDREVFCSAQMKRLAVLGLSPRVHGLAGAV